MRISKSDLKGQDHAKNQTTIEPVPSYVFESIEAYTSANLTNEVAERYLALNPNNANIFAELPDDWKVRWQCAYVERRRHLG